MLRDLAATRPSDGHRLHPDARRLRLPLRDDRLAHRHVQAWELSNTLDASFCVRAMTVYDVPEIYGTDRGSRFAGAEFTRPLLAAGGGDCRRTIRSSDQTRVRFMGEITLLVSFSVR